MSHAPFEDGAVQDEVVLCAGLPSAGVRPLTGAEQALLQRRARRQRVTTILWFAAIPACVAAPVLLWLVLSLILDDTSPLDGVLAAFSMAALALGIPLSLFFADIARKRHRVLRGTLSAGSVRRFEGTLADEDWTGDALGVLRRAGLAGEGGPGASTIELHAASDVIYQVNGVRPERWTAIELTRAAAPPASPARFTAAADWLVPGLEDELERRRLTPGEREEILQYARHARRRRWLQALAAGWFLAVVTDLLNSRLPGRVGFAAWAALSLLACAALFYRQTRRARLYEQDAAQGWALVIKPEQASVISRGEHSLTDVMEVLPISGAAWVIGGKPAGWRGRVGG